MALKLCMVLVMLCITQVCLSARLPRKLNTEITENELTVSTTKKATSSSEELTLEDIEKMRTEMLKTMKPEEVDRITNIFKKFTKDGTSEEKLEGVLELLLLAVSNNSTTSSADLMKLFKDSSESKELTKLS